MKPVVALVATALVAGYAAAATQSGCSWVGRVGDRGVIPYAISTPDGRIVPGYRTGDRFVDLNDGIWVQAEDGTWTPPAKYLDGRRPLRRHRRRESDRAGRVGESIRVRVVPWVRIANDSTDRAGD